MMNKQLDDNYEFNDLNQLDLLPQIFNRQIQTKFKEQFCNHQVANQHSIKFQKVPDSRSQQDTQSKSLKTFFPSKDRSGPYYQWAIQMINTGSGIQFNNLSSSKKDRQLSLKLNDLRQLESSLMQNQEFPSLEERKNNFLSKQFDNFLWNDNGQRFTIIKDQKEIQGHNLSLKKF